MLWPCSHTAKRCQSGTQRSTGEESSSPVTASFQLQNLSIRVGDTVNWTNRDAAPHTSTSGQQGVFDGSGWDSGNLPTNQSFSHKFMSAGSFPYTCLIHPSMNATVTVTQ